jgi:hypothetical protein
MSHPRPIPGISAIEAVNRCWRFGPEPIENENGQASGPEQELTKFIDGGCGANHRKRRICCDAPTNVKANNT